MDILTEAQTKIFIPDDEFVWVEAVIRASNDDSSLEVEILDQEYIASRKTIKKIVSVKDLPKAFPSFPLQNTENSIEGVDDMCSLNYLHEPSILDNLMRRFKALLPYTYTGEICVAVSGFFFN
jgi:myosin-5